MFFSVLVFFLSLFYFNLFKKGHRTSGPNSLFADKEYFFLLVDFLLLQLSVLVRSVVNYRGENLLGENYTLCLLLVEPVDNFMVKYSFFSLVKDAIAIA